jgi:hypothetical protein
MILRRMHCCVDLIEHLGNIQKLQMFKFLAAFQVFCSRKHVAIQGLNRWLYFPDVQAGELFTFHRFKKWQYAQRF